MAIIMDKKFYDDFFTYYGNVISTNVYNQVIKDITGVCGKECMDVAFNIAKTSNIIDSSYTEFHDQMLIRLTWELKGVKSLDKTAFGIAFVYLYEVHLDSLVDFLRVRLVVRDIYAEIAKDIYDVANEDTIEKIKQIKTEHTYSIQDPNPVSRDQWFYNLTLSVGSYSKCHSRKIGAVLVKDNSVISTGYNGPPRGVPTCDQRWFIDSNFPLLKENTKTEGICPRRVLGFSSGQGLEICPAGHAERNALINAAKLGIKTNKTKLYMSCGVPCTPCMAEIINAGVEEIVCSSMQIYDETAMYLLENSTIKVRIFDFLV